jgi:hypothetical protein
LPLRGEIPNTKSVILCDYFFDKSNIMRNGLLWEFCAELRREPAAVPGWAWLFDI